MRDFKQKQFVLGLLLLLEANGIWQSLARNTQTANHICAQDARLLFDKQGMRTISAIQGLSRKVALLIAKAQQIFGCLLLSQKVDK